MNPLLFTIESLVNFEFTINFANSLSYCEITMNSISFTRMHYDFTVCFGNLLWIQFFREFTILFSTQLWFHFLFGELTLNSLSISQICFKNASFIANKLKIHQQIANSLCIKFRSLRIHFLFREFTINSLTVSRNRCLFHENNINLLFVSIKLWIKCLYLEFTMN